jgi:exodeoxyribonuclease VII large subunit
MTTPRSRAPALTVTELAARLRESVEGATGQVWVRGEVRGLRAHGAGHWYFSLRDEASQLQCVMWRTYTRRLKAPPADGTEVYLLATPTLWTQRGDLRLAAVTLLPTAGVGLQQLAFERARERLERDGLLAPGRKRALPRFPRRLAVVTSPDGAALRDIVTVARRRWPAARLLLVGARVQGDEAEADLVAALAIVNRLDDIDLCIVARGGGGRDDLFVFNSEAVCRALAAVRVPTISAVGHETDVTLADLVADVRAPTPSAAAAIALPDRAEVARALGGLGTRLAHGLAGRSRLLGERLARLGDRARAGVETLLADRRSRLSRAAAALDALSPLAVLARGYSVARLADGAVVRRRAQLPAGRDFTLRVADGDVPARAR